MWPASAGHKSVLYERGGFFLVWLGVQLEMLLLSILFTKVILFAAYCLAN